MIDFTNLRTVKQVAKECPALTDRIIYHWIEDADKNGFHRTIVRIGRKVLIDVRELNLWLAEHAMAKSPGSA